MPNFSLWDRRRNVKKVAEEYCWVISHAVGQSYHGQSGSSVFEFGFKLDSIVYTQTTGHTYTQLWHVQNLTLSALPDHNYCVSLGFFVQYIQSS